MKNKTYFVLGLLLFYLIQFFSPNKLVYFFAYFVSTYIFYLSSKNIAKSLLYSLILSFFTEIGIASSWFKLDPVEISYISGYTFTPLTILIFSSLVVLFFKHRQFKLKSSDVLLFLFLVWNILIFLFYPNKNDIYGLLTLSEILIAYFLLRSYISRKDFENIGYLFISILIFQSVLGILQLIFQRNIGLIAESSTFSYPFGLTAGEDDNLFRITGGFGHANMLAVELLVLIPFLFVLKNKWMDILKIISMLVLFFTYSRAAWFIGFPLIIFLLRKYHPHFIPRTLFKKVWLITVALLVIFIFLWPSLYVRLQTIPQALSDYGSFDVRVKLLQEGWSLIQQYPITGVGINRFQQIASENSVTEIFVRNGFSAATRLHNLYAEMAVEIGLPGLFLFLLFIISIFVHYFKKKKKETIQVISFYSFIGLIIIAAFHPFYLIPQFRLFFLLAAVILVD